MSPTATRPRPAPSKITPTGSSTHSGTSRARRPARIGCSTASSQRTPGPECARVAARARRTAASISATQAAASWSPANGPERPSPTIARTAGTGSWPRSASRPTTPPATPGNPSPPAIPTTCPTGSGSCTSSPTASDGTLRSPKRGQEPAARYPRTFRQPGGPHDSHERPSASRTVADRRPGRRATQHQSTIHPAADRGAAHPLRTDRPAACPHPRTRTARFHRGRPRRAGHHQEKEQGRMTRKRRFGRVRQLASGRWQARYQGPDGLDRPAPETFASKTDAEVWLTLKEAEIRNGDWINPDDGKVSLAEYARVWIDERTGLRPKTVELYRYLLRKHLAQVLGPVPIADIQPGHVRRWRKTLLDDGVIRRNPCRIKGAGREKSPERPTLAIAQACALAEAIGQRYRALVLLAMFSSLRWGELGAVRRCDIDLAARTVRVSRQLAEARGGGFTFGPPKSEAGTRVVTIPEVIIPVVQWHLSCFAQPGDDGLVFTSLRGRPLRHSHFRQREWLPALKAAGLADFHFHDLRHSGNTLAASAGATLRELMDRMGHDSERAAMIYLHGSDARQHQIADSLSKLAREELKRGSKRPGGQASGKRSGTQRARNRKQAS